MTEQIETPVETDEVPEPNELNPALRRVVFHMTLSAYDIESLREGVDIAALNIGRYGLGAFFMVATDPVTGEQWVIQDGERVYRMADWEATGSDDDDEETEDAPAAD